MKTLASKISRMGATNVRVSLPKAMCDDCKIKKGMLVQWVREGNVFICAPTPIPTPTSHPIQQLRRQLALEVDAFVRSFSIKEMTQWEWDDWGGWWRGRVVLKEGGEPL